MAPELKHVYEAAIIGEIALKKPENMRLMRATADAYYANAPFRFRELLAGMAETSGLKSEELMLVNSVEQVSGLPVLTLDVDRVPLMVWDQSATP